MTSGSDTPNPNSDAGPREGTAGTENTAGTEGTAPSRGEPAVRRGRVIGVIVVAALLVVAAGVVYLVVRPQPTQEAHAQARTHPSAARQPANLANVSPDTTLVADRVSTSLAKVYSYDSAKTKQHEAQIQGLITGKARQEFEQSLDKLRDQPRTTVDTKVTGRAVTELHRDSATVLVSVRETLERQGQTGKPQPASARLLVTAHRNDKGSWQITGTDKSFDHPQKVPDTHGVKVAQHGGLSPVATARQRDLVLARAMSAAQVLSSVDYRNPKQSLQDTLRVTGGALHRKAQSSGPQNLRKIAGGHLIVHSQPVAAGLGTLDLNHGTASALVACNGTATGADGQQQSSPTTLALALRRSGQQWLVTKLQTL